MSGCVMQWTPCPERGGTGQPLASWSASSQSGEVGLHRCLVDEDEALGSFAHYRQAFLDPFGSLMANAGLAALGRNQRLFLYV